MELGMPSAQTQAWNNVKEAVDSYAKVSGSDIAVVARFDEPPQRGRTGDSGLLEQSSLTLYGHGNLLFQVKQCSSQLQNQHGVKGSGENGTHSQYAIPAPRKIANYHDQSVARSLTSTFQSLKLDGNPKDWKAHYGSRRKEKLPKRNQNPYPRNRDLAELDENLLFEDDSPEEEQKNSSDSDYDDGDDDDAFGFGGYASRPRPNQTVPDPSKSGTSLPVNINMNYLVKPEIRPHFSQMKFQNSSNHPQNFADGTPNPSKMMASIQALARSVTEDSAQIFGDRPRPSVKNHKYS